MSGSSDTAYTTDLCVASSYRTTCPSPHRPDRKPAIEIQHRLAHNVESAPDAGKNCLKGCVERKKAKIWQARRKFYLGHCRNCSRKQASQSSVGKGTSNKHDAWLLCHNSTATTINQESSHAREEVVALRQAGYLTPNSNTTQIPTGSTLSTRWLRPSSFSTSRARYA